MAGILGRLHENFAYWAWPLFGNGALEVLRVLDWAADTFAVTPPFAVGGESAGGDIAVAAAGLDARIGCVAACIATPDWKRPGSRVDGVLVPPGDPDAYALFVFESMNPSTRPSAYDHRPALLFECGEDDDHVPPDGAMAFQAALADVYGDAQHKVRVRLHPETGHETTSAMRDNCVRWLLQHVPMDGHANA